MVKKVRTTIAIDKEDYLYLQNFSQAHGLSFADVSRLALKEWIQMRKTRKTSQNQQQS